MSYIAHKERIEQMDQRASDTAEYAAAMATKAGYTSAAVVTIFGWTLSDIGIAVGILTTIAMAALNWYYQRKRHQLEMRRAKFDGIDVDGV